MQISRRPNPVTGAIPPARISFGFRFFSQIEQFGLREADRKWSASFFDRLAALSTKTWKELEDPTTAQRFRYHAVDWDAQSIPITRKELVSIPADYQDEDEYPFYQFSVSLALGRFAGFKDEQGVFQVVIIDPMHNLQPSQTYGYSVQPAGIVLNSYEELRLRLERVVQESQCSRGECLTLLQFQSIYLEEGAALLLGLSAEDFGVALNLVRTGVVRTLTEIFMEGLLGKI